MSTGIVIRTVVKLTAIVVAILTIAIITAIAIQVWIDLVQRVSRCV